MIREASTPIHFVLMSVPRPMAPMGVGGGSSIPQASVCQHLGPRGKYQHPNILTRALYRRLGHKFLLHRYL